MSNMEIWDRLKQPPKAALKAIVAGRLKGKTDINPQWRLQAMTEQFGPCGKGWSYRIEALWTEPGIDGQVFAFAQVSVRVGDSEPIPGIGGSMLIAKESGGLHHNDEAFKMATTDALSVALKALGVAADIYLGLWDGSKYKDAPALPKPDTVAADTLKKLEAENPGEEEFLRKHADSIKAAYKRGAAEGFGVFNEITKELDTDENVAIWAFFDSTQRSFIKKQQEAARTAIAAQPSLAEQA